MCGSAICFTVSVSVRAFAIANMLVNLVFIIMMVCLRRALYCFIENDMFLFNFHSKITSSLSDNRNYFFDQYCRALSDAEQDNFGSF
jgi:hypothetical protein